MTFDNSTQAETKDIVKLSASSAPASTNKSKSTYEIGFAKGFKQFRMGLSLFFVGMVIIYIASQMIEPSLVQELVAAVGVIFVVVGFVAAVMAEVRIVLNRLWTYFREK